MSILKKLFLEQIPKRI